MAGIFAIGFIQRRVVNTPYYRKDNLCLYEMEVEDDEDDVWDEKSLKQLKRKLQNPTFRREKSSAHLQKNVKSKRSNNTVKEPQRSSQLEASQASSQGKSQPCRGSRNARGGYQKRRRRISSSTTTSTRNEMENVGSLSAHDHHESMTLNRSSSVPNDEITPQKDIMEGCCPKCQMPFTALIGQSPGWHVRECLETKYSYVGDCIEGLHCRSTFSPHYRRYSHKLLATTRSYSSTEKNHKGESNSNKDVSVETKIQSSRQLDFSDQKWPEEIETNEADGKCGLTTLPSVEDSADFKPLEIPPDRLDMPTSSDNRELSSVGEMENKIETINKSLIGEFRVEVDSSKHPNQEECCESEHSPAANDEPMENGETEEFEMLSDDDLFGDPQIFEGLYRDTNASCLSAQDQDNDDSQGSVSMDGKQGQHFPQCLDSETQENCITIDHSNGVDEDQCPDHLEEKKSYKIVNREAQAKQSNKDQKQKSLLSFFPKENNKTTVSNAPLKQTDIGVFFGLKPLKKQLDSKGPTKDHTNVESSSQVASVSRRHGGWTGRKKYNHNLKQTGYSSEGQSSGHGEDVSAVSTGAQSRRSCPFYKKIPNSGITVDAFRYGDIPGCQAYFLSHFHYDHYAGLNGKFTNPIYCSKITANLVISKLYVKKNYVHPLPMNTPTIVDNVQVTLLEANHCPGAVLFLFQLSNGQTCLHTGDFRASAEMEQYPELLHCKVDVLYLDTTYCDPEYSFPPQEETINFAVSKAIQACKQNPKTLIVCGSYTIGKERVFLSIAEALSCKVSVEKQKKKVLDCLESDHLKSLITTDWKTGKVHVLPMAKLTLQSLTAYLDSHKSQFSELLAFKPTGWEHSAKRENLSMIKPSKRGNVTIYGVPYSEHSSFRELERFVKFVRPKKIIPTVNIYSAESRAQMQSFFNRWLSE